MLAKLRVYSEHKDHEADFLCLLPDYGVVVVEVKGSRVWMDEDGQWFQAWNPVPREIDPVDQATGTTYALRDYVEDDPRWWGGRLR